MPLTITCPSCHHMARVPGVCVGHRVKCPNCQQALWVSLTVKRPAQRASARPKG